LVFLAVIGVLMIYAAVEYRGARARVWIGPADVLVEWRPWFGKPVRETVTLDRITSIGVAQRRSPRPRRHSILTQRRIIFRLREGRMLPVSMVWETRNAAYRERALHQLRAALDRVQDRSPATPRSSVVPAGAVFEGRRAATGP
jgi:hypothetical protein